MSGDKDHDWSDTLPWITTAGAGTAGGLLGQRLLSKRAPILGGALGAMLGTGTGLTAGRAIGKKMDQIQKTADRSYAADFLAGVDPTGTRTFEYGMRDANAGGLSDARRRVGVAGGMVGGAAVIPAFIGGTIGAFRGAITGVGGLKQRAAGALAGFGRGATRPYTSIYRGMRANRALAAHQAGKLLTPEQAKHLQHFASTVLPSGAAAVAGKIPPGVLRQSLRAVSPHALSGIKREITAQVGSAVGALGLSGAIGGASASRQYSRGGTAQELLQKNAAYYRQGYRNVLVALKL